MQEETVAATVTPTFSELDPAACHVLLERNHVGRLAFSHGGRVDVQPVHYVLRDGWIYGRTSLGEKLQFLAHNWSVAFEVDEIHALFEWRSVVVHGGFYMLSPNGAPMEASRWQKALEALRSLVPETLTDNDPVPFRNKLFGIAVQSVTGREATTTRDDHAS
jgi:uncharacterized protein